MLILFYYGLVFPHINFGTIDLVNILVFSSSFVVIAQKEEGIVLFDLLTVINLAESRPLEDPLPNKV